MTDCTPRRYLVISPTGEDVSYHKEWIRGKRDFDLMLVNYGDFPGRYAQDAEYYYEMKGFKFEILKSAIETFRDKVKLYEAVWLPDDDLSISTTDINRLFQIFHEYNLDLAQASVKNSWVSYSMMIQRITSKLRYVNWVECMCPLFKTENLFQLLYTFNFNRSGWAIDFFWAKKLEGKSIAIIDEVGVLHTKPVKSGNYYKKLATLGLDECEDMEAIEKICPREEFRVYSTLPREWVKKMHLGSGLIFLLERIYYKFKQKYYSLIFRLCKTPNLSN